MTTTAKPRRSPWDLTDRELEILQLIAADTDDAAVAKRLVVSVDTVRTHMKRIRTKLGVRTRTGAVVKALRAGVIS